MPTTIDTTSFKTALGSCVDAIVAQNWTSARSYLLQAEVIMAGLALETGDEVTRLRRQGLDQLKEIRASLAEAQAAAVSAGEGRLIRTTQNFAGRYR